MHAAALLLAIALMGDDGTTSLPVADVPLVLPETITLACGSSCRDELPEDRYGDPLCSDYHLNTALIDGAGGGDRSAVSLLEQRYADAGTYTERHRLAGALLRKSSQDAAIWKELIATAELIVRFPQGPGGEPNDEYMQWCAPRGFDPEQHRWVAQHALDTVAHDPRSRPLLLRILETDDPQAIVSAIDGLAAQRAFTSLPAIERTLKRMEDGTLVFMLATFADDRADAVARKYLSEDQTETYAEIRAQSTVDREH